jgi:hypothetical protein
MNRPPHNLLPSFLRGEVDLRSTSEVSLIDHITPLSPRAWNAAQINIAPVHTRHAQHRNNPDSYAASLAVDFSIKPDAIRISFATRFDALRNVTYGV